mmetsp:Transcript_8493/g.19982  ORF Transcript_8493/g.19982 Transcript_8493/m.19982 type:complete len:203 (+) Transcript_8493:1601-2209(+)
MGTSTLEGSLGASADPSERGGCTGRAGRFSLRGSSVGPLIALMAILAAALFTAPFNGGAAFSSLMMCFQCPVPTCTQLTQQRFEPLGGSARWVWKTGTCARGWPKAALSTSSPMAFTIASTFPSSSKSSSASGSLSRSFGSPRGSPCNRGVSCQCSPSTCKLSSSVALDSSSCLQQRMCERRMTMLPKTAADGPDSLLTLEH